MSDRKITVALLLGGSSTERQISKLSAYAVYEALKTLGYGVILLDPAYGLKQPKEIGRYFEEKDYAEVSTKNYFDAVSLIKGADIAFIALHGKYGEDGTIQSILELEGIKYTGSGVLSSAISMDKIISKELFEKAGVPVPEGFFVESVYDGAIVKDKIAQSFKYPCVIKPNDQGSTIGLSICKSEDQVDDAIKEALKYSSRAVIEEFIPGREFTVGILDHQALPVCEIVPEKSLYDFEAKYTDGMTKYRVPAEIPDEWTSRMQELALKAYDAICCFGYGRIDFRTTPEGKSVCLEANNLPGLTGHSLLPKMAAAAGISFPNLIEKIISSSLNE